MRYEMRFTGSGGQGVILASIIFAEAAVLSGKKAIQSQAYGPEARGGMSRAETIISEGQVWFSKVICPEFLLALTQPALDKFSKNVAENAVIMIDESMTVPENLNSKKVIVIPVLRTAKEKIGKAMTANIVAVGAINSVLGLFPEDILQEAVKRHIPKGTENLNMRALKEGEHLIDCIDKTQFQQSIA